MTKPPRRRRFRKSMILLFFAVLLAPLAARATLFAFEDRPLSWRDADWSSVRALPAATEHPDARVLVLSGHTGGWKGVVATHSWIVIKRANAPTWTRYDVVGWGNPVRVNGWAPDGRWYGTPPTVIADLRGTAAEKLIPRIEASVKDYRWRNAGDYKIWPGPNSNSFVAAVLREIPELRAVLPANAVGRDFRPGFYAGLTDSGTGAELNLWGYAGIKLGWVEGFEINFFSLVVGLDFRNPAIKLPGFGRIGFSPLPVLMPARNS
jgi:hypothetical protein